jgi:DNA-directed RNA polymerase subunit RPC12/RpoP
MTSDAHLDGNVMGGLLMEVFGREMTDALGCCAHCGDTNRVGALIVYQSGPGDVVRCPSCSTVLIVATRSTGGPRVYFASLRWLQAAS